MDDELLINIRKLSIEINNLTKKIEKLNENTSIDKVEVENNLKNEILKKKYKILKLSSNNKETKQYNKEIAAGMPSNNKQNTSIINWKHSLRNPYFF